MGAREWSRSFLSPSPSASSTHSGESEDSNSEDQDASALQRSSQLTRRLDLSMREDSAVVPDANPFTISKKRSASQKQTLKSNSGSNIRPAGNVRPASERKAQTSVPDDVQGRRRGWSNGRGEPVPPVVPLKRKVEDDGRCKQIGGSRLPLTSKPSSKASSSPVNSQNKASKKKSGNDISFHRLREVSLCYSPNLPARDTEESRQFPIIAGLARQRALPTKSQKSEPNIDLIVSGHSPRRVHKPTSKSQDKSPTRSQTLEQASSLQQWLSAPSSSVLPSERGSTVRSSPSPLEDEGCSQPPATPPAPSLLHPSGTSAEYASSAVTMLKTPSTVKRAPHRVSTPKPSHAQLLEDMVEQLPRGYSLHENDSLPISSSRERGAIPDLQHNSECSCTIPPSLLAAAGAPLPPPHSSSTPTTSSKLAQFRFKGQPASVPSAPAQPLPQDLTGDLTPHLQAFPSSSHHPFAHLSSASHLHANRSADAHLEQRSGAQRPSTPAPPRPSQRHPIYAASAPRPRPSLLSTPSLTLPANLTPKFSSPAQVTGNRHLPAYPTSAVPHARPPTRVQPAGTVTTGPSYLGLYQPKSNAAAGGSGKRRLTLPPAKTSYSSGRQITTWEPTPLAHSRAVTVHMPQPSRAAYVPRHLRALQEASQVQAGATKAASVASSEDDWDRDWRTSVNRAA